MNKITYLDLKLEEFSNSSLLSPNVEYYSVEELHIESANI